MSIKHNRVLCLNCNTIIESKHVHDYVSCACTDEQYGVSVDGGQDYFKRAFGAHSKYIELPGESCPSNVVSE